MTINSHTNILSHVLLCVALFLFSCQKRPSDLLPEKRDASSLIENVPTLLQLEERLDVPYQVDSHTQIQKTPAGSDSQERKQNVVIDVNFLHNKKDWQLSYQLTDLNSNQPRKGGAIFKDGHFYRRIEDNPLIHRKMEAGEKEKLFSSKDSTKQLLGLFQPFLKVSESVPFVFRGQKVQKYTLVRNDATSDVPMPSPTKGSQPGFQKAMRVDMFEGTLMVDQKTNVPIHAEFTARFSYPPNVSAGPMVMDGEDLSGVSFEIHQNWDVKFPVLDLSIQKPSDAKEMPVRSRSKGQEVLSSGSKK